MKFFSSFRAAYHQGRLTFSVSLPYRRYRWRSVFLGYVLSTILSFRIIFFSASCCTIVTGGIMMNSRQLQWWSIITRVANLTRNVLVRKCTSVAKAPDIQVRFTIKDGLH